MATFRGQPPDRIAWASMIDGFFLASLPAEFQREHLGSATQDTTSNVTSAGLYGVDDEPRRRVIDFTRLVGMDVLERPAPGLKCHIDDLTIEENYQGQKIQRRHLTSAGILTDTFHSTPGTPAYPFVGAEYKIKTIEDIQVYRHIWENTRYEPDYERFLADEAYIGDDGVAVIGGLQTAVQFLLGEEAGVANFYYLLRDHPKEMEALIETMHSKIREGYEILAHSPAQVVIAVEDLSSNTSSPAIFERYSWRHLNEYADIVHAEGKILVAHMCGRLRAMAPLIAKSKLDGVESLTLPPIGDLSVREARELWGEDFIIIGGLNAHVMLETDQDKVRATVFDVLEQAAPGFNFILSNGGAVPYGTSLETLQTIAQIVKEHAVFPLRSGG